MNKRLMPLVGIALAGLMITPMWATTAPATTYGFEECAEGWTVTESRNDPADDPGEWKPSPPGNPGGTPLQAFRTQPYPFAAQAGDPEAVSYEAWLTSPVHSFGGASKISFFVKYDIEFVEPNPVVTGGDFLYVERSMNGGETFKKVKTFQGVSEGFVKHEVRVPAAGQVVLRFHLYSDNNVSGESGAAGEIAIDDVVFPTPRPAGTTCEGGGGEQCTKSGDGKANTIRGTDGPDRLCGKGGNDKLYGKGGRDTLLGGKGRNDVCVGGGGKDTFKGCEEKRQ